MRSRKEKSASQPCSSPKPTRVHSSSGFRAGIGPASCATNAGVPRRNSRPATIPSTPDPGTLRTPLVDSASPSATAAAASIAFAIGCSEPRSSAHAARSASPRGDHPEGLDCQELHAAQGQSPGLVEDHVRRPRERLEGMAAGHYHAEPRQGAGGRRERRGRGEGKCAGTTYHQYRHGNPQRARWIELQPHQASQRRDDQQRADEPVRDAIRNLRQRRLIDAQPDRAGEECPPARFPARCARPAAQPDWSCSRRRP